MSKGYIVSFILTIIAVFMIGIGIGYGIGYAHGTYKINKCKTMTVDEVFDDQNCREFYLGE